MADAITSQTIEDGGKNLIVKITNIVTVQVNLTLLKLTYQL